MRGSWGKPDEAVVSAGLGSIPSATWRIKELSGLYIPNSPQAPHQVVGFLRGIYTRLNIKKVYRNVYPLNLVG